MLKVFSWSVGNRAYDDGAKDGSSPRSFLSVISEAIHPGENCTGMADDDAGEGRMDSEFPTCVLHDTCVGAHPWQAGIFESLALWLHV